jgi:hypothetical protein
VKVPVAGVHLRQSVVDPGAAGGDAIDCLESALIVEESTVFGATHARRVDANAAIFTRTVKARRQQEGCMRFSYVPAGSTTPRRYRCQPEFETTRRIVQAEDAARRAGGTLAEAERSGIRADTTARIAPAFTSVRYGDPGYAQLDLHGPAQIARGAEDGSEMGAFSFLENSHREQNLRSVLEEYVPLGLEAGLIYVT